MKRILTGGCLAATLALGGTALAQSSMPPSSQPYQQQQPAAQPPAQAPAQTGQTEGQSQLPTRTFEGRVKDFTNNTVTLDVAGDDVKIKASKVQTAQLQKGQTVQVQAQPSLEAVDVQPVQGAFAGDKLIGTVEEVQNNKVTLRTSGGGMEQVRISEKAAQKLQTGQQVVVQLREDPRRANDWQATAIKPMRSTM